MAFLLVEILALILLSAAAGAGLAYWWLRRGLEDVTTEYDALQQRTRNLEVQRPILDQMGRRLEAVERMLGEAPAEPPALSARLVEVERKLDAWSVAGVEGQNRLYEAVSAIDLRPVLERLHELEQRGAAAGEELLVRIARLEGLEQRLDSFRFADLERVVAASVAALAGRLDAVERALGHPPEIDWGPVLRSVERGFAEIPPPADLTPVLAACTSVRAAVAAIPPAPALDPVLARLEDLSGWLEAAEQATAHAVEDQLATVQQAIVGRVDALTAALAGLRAIELSELVPQFEAVRVKLDGMRTPDVTDLSAGIAALTSTVASLRVPNFEQLALRLASIERRLERLSEPAVDLGPVLARMETIEGRIESLGGHRTPDASLIPTAVEAPTAPPSPPVPELSQADLRASGRNLLIGARFGPPDNLEIVRGIGPKLTELLYQLGVYYFWQVADWGPDDIAFVDSQLEQFQGRIERDQWVMQCRALAAEPGAARRPIRAGQG